MKVINPFQLLASAIRGTRRSAAKSSSHSNRDSFWTTLQQTAQRVTSETGRALATGSTARSTAKATVLTTSKPAVTQSGVDSSRLTQKDSTPLQPASTQEVPVSKKAATVEPTIQQTVAAGVVVATSMTPIAVKTGHAVKESAKTMIAADAKTEFQKTSSDVSAPQTVLMPHGAVKVNPLSLNVPQTTSNTTQPKPDLARKDNSATHHTSGNEIRNSTPKGTSEPQIQSMKVAATNTSIPRGLRNLGENTTEPKAVNHTSAQPYRTTTDSTNDAERKPDIRAPKTAGSSPVAQENVRAKPEAAAAVSKAAPKTANAAESVRQIPPQHQYETHVETPRTSQDTGAATFRKMPANTPVTNYRAADSVAQTSVQTDNTRGATVLIDNSMSGRSASMEVRSVQPVVSDNTSKSKDAARTANIPKEAEAVKDAVIVSEKSASFVGRVFRGIGNFWQKHLQDLRYSTLPGSTATAHSHKTTPGTIPAQRIAEVRAAFRTWETRFSGTSEIKSEASNPAAVVSKAPRENANTPIVTGTIRETPNVVRQSSGAQTAQPVIKVSEARPVSAANFVPATRNIQDTKLKSAERLVSDRVNPLTATTEPVKQAANAKEMPSKPAGVEAAMFDAKPVQELQIQKTFWGMKVTAQPVSILKEPDVSPPVSTLLTSRPIEFASEKRTAAPAVKNQPTTAVASENRSLVAEFRTQSAGNTPRADGSTVKQNPVSVSPSAQESTPASKPVAKAIPTTTSVSTPSLLPSQTTTSASTVAPQAKQDATTVSNSVIHHEEPRAHRPLRNKFGRLTRTVVSPATPIAPQKTDAVRIDDKGIQLQMPSESSLPNKAIVFHTAVPDHKKSASSPAEPSDSRAVLPENYRPLTDKSASTRNSTIQPPPFAEKTIPAPPAISNLSVPHAEQKRDKDNSNSMQTALRAAWSEKNVTEPEPRVTTEYNWGTARRDPEPQTVPRNPQTTSAEKPVTTESNPRVSEENAQTVSASQTSSRETPVRLESTVPLMRTRLTIEQIRELQAMTTRALQSVQKAADGTAQTSFNWSPEGLGTLRFNIAARSDDVRIEISSSRRDVVEALEENRGTIERMIGDLGLRVERFEVRLRTSDVNNQLPQTGQDGRHPERNPQANEGSSSPQLPDIAEDEVREGPAVPTKKSMADHEWVA